MSKSKVPPVSLLQYEVRTYSWPNTPCIVFNPAPRVFIPMIKRGELLTMDPDVPVCPTLEAAQAYHNEQIKLAQEAVKKEQAPQLYVPPGRGRLQA